MHQEVEVRQGFYMVSCVKAAVLIEREREAGFGFFVSYIKRMKGSRRFKAFFLAKKGYLVIPGIL